MSYSTISAVNNRGQIVRSVKHAKLVKWVGLVVCFFFALVIGQEVWDRWGYGQQGRMGLGTLLFVAGAGLDVAEEEEEDGLGDAEELEPTSSGVMKCTKPLMSVHLRNSQTT